MSDDAGNHRKDDPSGPAKPPAGEPAAPSSSFFAPTASGSDGNSGLLDIRQIQQLARERAREQVREEAATPPPPARSVPPPDMGVDGNSGLLDIRRLQSLAFERQAEMRTVQDAMRRAEAERAEAERRLAEEARRRAEVEAEAARLRAEAEALEKARLDALRAQIEAERRARIELQIAHDLKLAELQAEVNARRVSTTTALTFVAAAVVLVVGAGFFGQTYVEGAARAMAIEAQDGQSHGSSGAYGSEPGGEPSVFSLLDSLFGDDSDHDRHSGGGGSR